MITTHSILIKGQWYGCADDACHSFGTNGSWGSALDNFKSGDDLCISTAGFGRPKVGKGGSDGIFCGSGIYPNGGKRKA